MVDRLIYNTVLSQAFSPCGNYLAASNTYGDIAVFSLNNVSNPSEDIKATNGVQHPLHHISGMEGGNVCSLVATPDFLIVGGIGEIRGFEWKTIISGKSEQSFKIQVPLYRDRSEPTDVNCLVYNSLENHLYAGCGDNNIYVFNLEDGKLIRTLKGHTNYIHSIHMSDNQLVSASEDGTVRLWEARKSSQTGVIKPYTNGRLARPELGNWIGAAAINDDWLVCGGGPRLALWHLRSMEVTTVFPVNDLKGVHVAKFHEDRVFAGGAGPNFYQLSLNGQIYGQIPTSASTVYSAEFQESPQKILAIAGSSTYVDICTNFNYLDQKLTFALSSNIK
ncbi:THO complex subunit 6 [Thrips palmi]|uniref:THO complex subunit 6 n=1 Tax=Thrips palmi TaxID=161013 RepID=A0A6P9A231_THRPL|nr:THO complex subunit 6 [Thrips palmi]